MNYLTKSYPFHGFPSYGIFFGDHFSFGGLLDTYRFQSQPQFQVAPSEIQRGSISQAIDQFIRLYFLPASTLRSSDVWNHLLSPEFSSTLDNISAIHRFVDQSIAEFTCGDLDIENDWSGYLDRLETMGLPAVEAQIDAWYGDTPPHSQSIVYTSGSFNPAAKEREQPSAIWTHYLPQPTVATDVPLTSLGIAAGTQPEMSEVASAIAGIIGDSGYSLDLTYIGREKGFLVAIGFEAFDCASCERLSETVALRVMLNWITDNKSSNWGFGENAAPQTWRELLIDVTVSFLQYIWPRAVSPRPATPDVSKCSRVIIFEIDNRVDDISYLNVTDVTVEKGLKYLANLDVDRLPPNLADVRFERSHIRASVYEYGVVDGDWDFIRNVPIDTTRHARAVEHLLDFGISL